MSYDSLAKEFVFLGGERSLSLANSSYKILLNVENIDGESATIFQVVIVGKPIYLIQEIEANTDEEQE